MSCIIMQSNKFQSLILRFHVDLILYWSIQENSMPSYEYSPLCDPNEISVLILEPSYNLTAPLRGYLTKIRLLHESAHLDLTSEDSDGGFNKNALSRNTCQWQWSEGDPMK